MDPVVVERLELGQGVDRRQSGPTRGDVPTVQLRGEVPLHLTEQEHACGVDVLGHQWVEGRPDPGRPDGGADLGLEAQACVDEPADPAGAVKRSRPTEFGHGKRGFAPEQGWRFRSFACKSPPRLFRPVRPQA